MTQKREVLQHLRRTGTLTPLEAIGVYGIFRLAARINDLRGDGYSINTEIRRDTKGRSYASYSINP